jgi:multiple sugar transport system permease protein
MPVSDATSTSPPVASVALTDSSQVTLRPLNWGILEAGVVVTMIPCIIIFLLLQRYYVKGMTAGAVK